MDYNVYGDGDYPSYSLGELFRQFRQMDVFGSSEEEVCLHSAPGFLPDDSSADVRVYVRYGTPKAQIVSCLRAATKRAAEEDWK